MKHCFLLLLHKGKKQSSTLINCLSEYSDVYIHVDNKSSDLYFYLMDKFSNNSNVYFVENRMDIFWGGVNIVKAMFLLMIKSSENKKYEHYTFLSGECVPIENVSAFLSFLSMNKDKTFIKNKQSESFRKRVDEYHFFINSKFYKYWSVKLISKALRYTLSKLNIKNKSFLNLKIYKGELWMTLSHISLIYLIEKSKSYEYGLDNFLHSKILDEIYIQTLLMNSEHKNKIINDNLMLINWSEASKHPNHTSLLSLKQSKKISFFSRKYLPGEDLELDDYLQKKNKNFRVL